jgi:hypothetical protein
MIGCAVAVVTRMAASLTLAAEPTFEQANTPLTALTKRPRLSSRNSHPAAISSR